MNQQSQWTRELAMEYFSIYARFEKVPLENSIAINSSEKIRGKVGAAEIEYRESEKLLIVRGLIDKDISKGDLKFKELLLSRVLEENLKIGDRFNGATFEYDTTAYELQIKYPERLNLKMDFHEPISKTEFVKKVDELMDISYKYTKNEYTLIFNEVNEIVFPNE